MATPTPHPTMGNRGQKNPSGNGLPAFVNAQISTNIVLTARYTNRWILKSFFALIRLIAAARRSSSVRGISITSAVAVIQSHLRMWILALDRAGAPRRIARSLIRDGLG